MNNNRNIKTVCDRCNFGYKTGPFENMMGNGELSYTKINVYGDVYNLCPSCTSILYNWLHEKENLNA